MNDLEESNENKSCKNCKYYYHQKCNNKNFESAISPSSNKDADINQFLEDGLIEGYLQEHVETKDISEYIINKLNENGYINKRKTEPNFEKLDEYEGLSSLIVEICSGAINDFVIDKIMGNVELELEIDSEFCCRFWE